MNNTISLNHLISIKNTIIPPTENLKGEIPEVQLPFFSKTKISDRYLSYMMTKGHLSSEGTLTEEYNNKVIPPLENAQFESIQKTLSTKIEINKPTINRPLNSTLLISTPINSFLQEVNDRFTNSKNRNPFCQIRDILFVGGIVPYCLQKDLLMRWLTVFLNDNQLADELFNHDFFQQIERFPSDIDTRILIENPSLPLDNLRNEIYTILSTKATSSMSNEEYANILKSLSNKYANIDAQTGGLVREIIKAAYLLKTYIPRDSKDQFAIISFGERFGVVFELLLQLNLERTCLFRRDSLRLSLKDFLETGQFSKLKLESDYSINQIFSDWNGQIIHVPDFSLADEDDWVTLISRMISKGERCLVANTEKRLFEVLQKKAKEKSKEPLAYIIERLKKRLLNHHQDNSTQTIALAFQACTSLKASGISSVDVKTVWKALTSSAKDYFLQIDNNSSLLHQITMALENEKISFGDVLACLELGAFLVLNKTQESNDSAVILTNHEGPAVQITIGVNGEKIHLWHCFNPKPALEHIKTCSTLPEELQNILKTFYGWSNLNPIHSSTIKVDLLRTSFDMALFENEIDQLIQKSDPFLASLGLQLFLMSQRFVKTSNISIIKRLPTLLPAIESVTERSCLCESISYSYPSLTPFLNQILGCLNQIKSDEKSFVEKWIVTAASTTDPSLWQVAKDLACDKLEKSHLKQLFKKLLPAYASFAIALLTEFSKRNLLSSDEELRFLGGICLQYPNCKLSIHRDLDLSSLYNSTDSLLKLPLLPIPKEPETLALLSNSFVWLTKEILDLKEPINVFRFLNNLYKKGFCSTHQSELISLHTNILNKMNNKEDAQGILEILAESKKSNLCLIQSKLISEELLISIAQKLYRLNIPEATYFSDKCVENILKSSNKNAQDLIYKYLLKSFETDSVIYPINIMNSNLIPEEKIHLLLKCLEINLKKSNLPIAQDSLNHVLQFDLSDSIKISTQKFAFDLILLILKNKKNPMASLSEAEKLVFNEPFRKLFKNSSRKLIEIYLFLFDKTSTQTPYYSKESSLTTFFLLIETLSESNELSSSTWLSIFKNVLRSEELFSQNSYYSKLLNSHFTKLSLLYKNLCAFDFNYEACQLLNFFIQFNLPIETSKHPILETVFSALSKKTSAQQDRNIPYSILEKFFLNNDQISFYIEDLIKFGPLLIDHLKIEKAIYFAKSLIENKNINAQSIQPFIKKLFNYLNQIKEFEQLAILLLSCKSQKTELSSLISIESLFLNLITIPYSEKKHALVTTIFTMFKNFDFKEDVWVKTIHFYIALENIEFLKNLWEMLIEEAETKVIFSSNANRISMWGKILNFLSNKKSYEVLDIFINKTLIDRLAEHQDETMSNQDLLSYTSLILLAINASTEKCKLEPISNNRLLLMNSTLELINDVKISQNKLFSSFLNTRKLEIASLYFKELNFTQFVMGFDLLEEVIEDIKDNPKNYFNESDFVILESTFFCFLKCINTLKDPKVTQLLNIHFESALNWSTIIRSILNVKVHDVPSIVTELTKLKRSDFFLEAELWITPFFNISMHKIYNYVTTKSEKLALGIAAENLILNLISFYEEPPSNNASLENTHFYIATKLFTSRYLQDCLPSTDYAHKWSNMAKKMIEHKAKISHTNLDIVFFKEFPFTPLMNCVDDFIPIVEAYVNLLSTFYCALDLPSKDPLYYHFYGITEPIWECIKKQPKHLLNHDSEIQEKLLLMTKNALETINFSPFTSGSKKLYELCANDFLYFNQNKKIKSEIHAYIGLMLIKLSLKYEVDKTILYRIGEIQKINQIFLPAKRYEINLCLNYFDVSHLTLEEKRAIAKNLLASLLQEKLTGNIIVNICNLLNFIIIKEKLYELPEQAFDNDQFSIYDKFMEMIQFSRNQDYKLFSNKNPLRVLLEILIYQNNTLHIFGQRSPHLINPDQTIKLLISMAEVLADLSSLESYNVPENLQFRLKFATYSLFYLTCIHSNKHFIKNFDSYLKCLKNIFKIKLTDFPMTDPGLYYLLTQYSQVLLIPILYPLTSFQIARLAELRAIGFHELLNYPKAIREQNPDKPYLELKAFELVLNSLFQHPMVIANWESYQYSFGMNDLALSYGFNFLSNNFKEGVFKNYTKYYIKLCRNYISNLLKHLDFSNACPKKQAEFSISPYVVDNKPHIHNTFTLIFTTYSTDFSESEKENYAEMLSLFLQGLSIVPSFEDIISQYKQQIDEILGPYEALRTALILQNQKDKILDKTET